MRRNSSGGTLREEPLGKDFCEVALRKRLWLTRRGVATPLIADASLGKVFDPCMWEITSPSGLAKLHLYRFLSTYPCHWDGLNGDLAIRYVHSSIKDGELGIPSMRRLAPLLRKNRLEGLCAENRLGNMSHFLEREIAQCEHTLVYEGNRLQSNSDVKKHWSSLL